MPVPGNIESGLEAFRRTVAPPVIDGEHYLAHRQASYDGGSTMFACWKPGYLFLTATRLLFYQGESQLFEVALADVQSVEILTRRWLSRRDCEQLVVTYQTRRGPRSVCLRTENLEKWRESIQEHIPEKTETEPTADSERPTEPTTDHGEPDTGQRSGILPATSRRDGAESTPESSHLATPWAAYEAWRGRFGSPPFLERREHAQTSDLESEIS